MRDKQQTEKLIQKSSAAQGIHAEDDDLEWSSEEEEDDDEVPAAAPKASDEKGEDVEDHGEPSDLRQSNNKNSTDEKTRDFSAKNANSN